jgi:hypothetical protein
MSRWRACGTRGLACQVPAYLLPAIADCTGGCRCRCLCLYAFGLCRCYFFALPFTAAFYARARAHKLRYRARALHTGQTPRCPSVACWPAGRQASRTGHHSSAPAPRGQSKGRGRGGGAEGGEGEGERGRERRGGGEVSCSAYMLIPSPSPGMLCHTESVRSECLFQVSCMSACSFWYVCLRLYFFVYIWSLPLARASPGPFLHLRLRKLS